MWTTLSEGSYPRMMAAAAKWIRAQAKKETGLKDSDLGPGWWIDLKLENKVWTIEKESNSEDKMVLVQEKEKKKKLKGGAPTKRKRGMWKKVLHPLIRFEAHSN